MHSTIHDFDYMDMEIGIAYRFLNPQTVLTELHDHNYCEYFIVISGNIIHEINGTTQKLKMGDICFIRPSDCHRYDVDGSEDCNLINVSFKTSYFESIKQYFNTPVLDDLFEALQPPVITLPNSRISILKKKHRLLNVGCNKSEIKALLMSLICDVFADFIIEYKKQMQNSVEKWLQSALIQMNTPENIEEGLPALIRYSGFSHGHLCRIMKKEFGVTPSQYVTDLRLQYAANLLSTTDYDILFICVQVGFSSLSHFTTIFKEKYGISPSKYRASHSTMGSWK